ncbi:MAG: hypothetical protein ACI9JZ_002825, partial [Lentimonas sp.]
LDRPEKEFLSSSLSLPKLSTQETSHESLLTARFA